MNYFYLTEIILLGLMVAAVAGGAWLLFSQAVNDCKRAKELDRDKRN